MCETKVTVELGRIAKSLLEIAITSFFLFHFIFPFENCYEYTVEEKFNISKMTYFEFLA